MGTFITELESSGPGIRVAVKDLINVEGVPTTAGSLAVARTALPAERDAACLAGLRLAGARIVGKANLHELAMLPIGTNPHFGNPVNPLDPALIPGGSSSGSATAVAEGLADVALGTDTGGSVRVPAACCGIAGLKTTYGRIPLDGVWPLAPSLDTVGPLATTIAGLVTGMELLEPGFCSSPTPAFRIGRIRTASDPAIEAAIDAALAASELEVVTLDWDGFDTAERIFLPIVFSELYAIDHELVAANLDVIGPDIIAIMERAHLFMGGLAEGRAALGGLRRSVDALFDQVELLALPTLPCFPPQLAAVLQDVPHAVPAEFARHLSIFNVTGNPATAQPIPIRRSLPASLQLVGPHGAEELLLATAQRVESALS